MLASTRRRRVQPADATITDGGRSTLSGPDPASGPAAGRGLLSRDANAIVEDELARRLSDLETLTKADLLAYMGPITDEAHDPLRVALDELDGKANRLLVLLETSGGYAESAERVQRLFRHNYQIVEFVVPGFAMSAGTVLVMSGDAIYMDYSSILGPIDPQVQRNGVLVPALGYIERYEQFMRRANRGSLNTAELMYLMQQFDPGDLAQYEHARDLSIALLKDWLVRYKFKNWTTTRDTGRLVTPKMRTDRAVEIAKALADTKRWHSHSRGIALDVLVKDLKLLINDLGDDPPLHEAVRSYYVLLKDYMIRRNHQFVWQTRRGHHGR